MKFKIFAICCAFLSYNYIVQAVSFVKTREEEIKEVVESYHARHPELKKEDLYAKVENYSKGDDIFPISKLIFEGKASDNEEKI